MTEMPDPKAFVNEGAADHPRTAQGQPDTGTGALALLRAVRRAALGTPPRTLVALTLATYGDRDGGGIRPGVSRLVADTRLGERTIHRELRELERMGVLVVVTAGTPLLATVYRMSMARLAELERPERPPRARRRGATVAPPATVAGVSEPAARGATDDGQGCQGGTLPVQPTCQNPPDARASAREGAGFDMHTSGAQSARSEPPTDGTSVEPAGEAEPVRLVAGQLVLSDSHRAYWLGPDLFDGDAVALDLALTEAAGAVQTRGAHSLDIQVRRQLARITRQRRDQDRRYRQARAASGSSAPARPSWGAKPGTAETARSAYAARPGGGYIYGRFTEDSDDPRWYRLASLEGQVYRAYCEAEGLEADLAKLERQGGLKLRPSAARQLLATGRPGAQPVNGPLRAVLARAADLQRAQQQEPGHA